MGNLVHAMKRHASGVAAGVATARYGIVQSVDPVNYSAKVLIQPENVLSGWLPIHSQWIGNGWGMVTPPSPGDQVKLIPQEGDAEQLAVAGSEYSTTQVPPQAPAALGGDATTVQPGEFALVHQSGATFRMCADGTVYIKGATVNIDGDLHVSGAVIAGYGGSDQVGVQTHTHTQGNDTHGDGEEPTQPPTAGT